MEVVLNQPVIDYLKKQRQKQVVNKNSLQRRKNLP